MGSKEERRRRRTAGARAHGKPTTSIWQQTLLLALALLVAAFAIRAIHLQSSADSPYHAAPIMDERDHHEWAARIAQGQGSDYLPFYRAPGYPHALGALYAVVGRDAPAGRWLSAWFGALTVAVTFLIGVRVAGRGAALIAAALLACYPPALYFDGRLLGTSLETLLFATVVLALVAATESGRSAAMRWRWAIALGLALGLATITRPTMGIGVPIALVFLFLRLGRDARRHAAIVLILAALPVLLVTSANLIGGKDRVLLAWSGGVNFFIGNNAESNGWSVAAPGLTPSLWQGQTDAKRAASTALGRQAAPSEVSRYWLGRGLDFVTGEPGAWTGLLGRKLLLLIGASEISNNQNIAAFRQYSPLLRLPLGFALILALAVPQLIRRRTWRQPLPWFIAFYALAVVAFFVTSRFRMPIVPLLMVLAAQTVVEAWSARRQRQWPTVARLAGVALAAGLLSVVVRSDAGQVDLGEEHYSLGNRYFESGAYEQAIAEYEQVLATPTAPVFYRVQALNNIAASHLREERAQPARQALRRSLALEPSAEAFARLGWSFFQEGRNDSARSALTHSLEMAPDSPESLYYLGHVARVQGAADEAIELWERAVQLNPDPSQQQFLYYALATLYVQTGREPTRALFFLDRITQPFPNLPALRAACEAARSRQ